MRSLVARGFGNQAKSPLPFFSRSLKVLFPTSRPYGVEKKPITTLPESTSAPGSRGE